MALKVYTNREDVKKAGLDLIDINDSYFDIETSLVDSSLTNKILETIDKAKYNSPLTFIGRTKELGALNKSNLSTGSKTLLNIVSSPSKCFNVCECGDNALSLLPLIKDGNIFWEFPIVAYDGSPECDIICNSVSYNNFYDFLESIEG